MNTNKKLIYLDNNATTKIDKKVLEVMMPFLTSEYANANSTHQFGVYSHEAVKNARYQVADLIGAEPHEIVFTSGSTEAINLAIKGIAENYQVKGKHIITVSTEHSAVLDTCKYLESRGFSVTYLSVNNEGLIDLEELKSKITGETILVSIMLANNETGVLQSTKEIAEIVHNAGSLFMTDTTQAIGKIDINVDEIGIDLLCLSGHKMYAPKGIGALFVRQRINRIKLPALLHGGGHEKSMRSGTLNVPGIVALGEAARLAKIEMRENAKNIKVLRDYLESELLKLDGTKINGSVHSRLFNTTNILFKGFDSDAIILGLSNQDNDLPIIAVSNGSACTSTNIEPSHVLTAMGLDEIDAFCSIRFSIGKYNSKEEIFETINSIKNTITILNQFSN
jgi:cysteine desulfurase